MLPALVIGASAAAPSPPSTLRVDAAVDGLNRYFGTTQGFIKSCGATGGNGGASRFECKCQTATHPPFCTNCWRWWMAGSMQSLVELNAAVPNHPSRNTTLQLLDDAFKTSPFTTRYNPSWAYIDDYLWYTLLWLRVHQFHGAADTKYLDEAAATFDLMYEWGSDEVVGDCGGIFWMYPDNDAHGARKNAITTLEATAAAAQLALAYRKADPSRSQGYAAQARQLWKWVNTSGLLSAAPLVQDNVSAATGSSFLCCNGTSAGEGSYGQAARCAVRGSGATTWSYNQGMLLGAATDMHALTGDATYLALAARVLDATAAHMTRPPSAAPAPPSDDDASDDDPAAAPKAVTASTAAVGVLTEPVELPPIEAGLKCDAAHDPSTPIGGDAFSFKMVYFVQLPRFVAAVAAVAKSASNRGGGSGGGGGGGGGGGAFPAAAAAATLATARALVSAASDAAWTSRVKPPFSAARDVCLEPTPLKPARAGAPPKFTWDWAPPPQTYCTDGRTQASAMALFVSEVLISQTLERVGGVQATRREAARADMQVETPRV